VAPGTQNISGTWQVIVSKTNKFDDKSKLKSAPSEPPGLTTTAYTFQILDAVVVASAPAPGSACPAATPENHSAGTGATNQTIAICGKNRATLALTPTALQASLGGTFIASAGSFASGSIAANTASSVVLGNWSNVTITGTSGPNKTIITKVGSASNRTSPLTTLANTCPATSPVGETCVNNGGYTAIDDAPSVTSTSPADGADHVAINTNIVVNFSESVTASGSSFTLECPTGTAKSFTVSGSPGSSITLDPTADLPEGTVCAVKVIANQISDTDALDPPDNMAADYNFSFTTDSAPSVTSTSPADGATNVAISSNIVVSFSEAVTASGSSFTLECPSGTPKSFSVTGSGTSSITIDPSADFPATTTCTVTVLAAGISDVDTGDPPDNLAANYVFSFTTVDAAPSVTSTSPADGADHVATNTNVVVNFSEPVTASGSSFTLECPTGTPESFTVSGSPGSSITLDPTSSLPEGTVCAVKVIANQISDVDAVDPPDNMAADYSFSFTTDAAPAVTTTTPADGATDVDPSANIAVGFNEAVDVTTSSFTVSCDSNPQTFTVSGTGTSSITLDPSADLPSTSSCTVTAVAANISDSDTGDPPDHPAANFVFSFTTQDAAPSVTSTSPADTATGVPIGANIVINFSEPVTATGSSFTLDCPTGTPQAFTVSGSPGSAITLDPTANLSLNTTCTVTVIADQISDTDPIDPPDTMTVNYVFSFTTAADQAPTDINLSNSSVNENQPSGTTVGTLSTADPDVGDTFTYSLVSGTGDTDNGSFQIVGDTLKTNAIFDFETKSSYLIRVRSTDSGSLFFEKQFTISVNDVNEAPSDISLSHSSTDENQPVATTIGALTATDPDTGQTHSFTLQNTGCGGGPFPDNGSFSISSGDLKSAVSFNYETKPSYTICVRTTDNGSPNLSFDKQFTITINDVNDAPVAAADSYSGAIGNTLAVVGTTGSGPNVVLTGNVLTNNDTDEDATFPHTLTAVAETNPSTGGGTATISTDGSFTFLPGVGDKNQNDTFTYHVTDGSLTSAGTVTVHIDNFLVWYVDNASIAATHDGRSSSPFLDLSSLNGAGGSGDSDGTDDYIFLYQGSGNYGGGIPLEATQKLFGEKHGLNVNSISLVPAGSIAPVITNASGTGVGLASGVDVQGLDISGTSGDAINGSAVTTATVGTTTAVNISSAGGDGVDLSGAGSGNISIASPITGSAGHSVSVAGRSGGTTSFSGAISDTGTGISLSGNTGATINLTGGVTASTGTSNAFAATGGGTVNVTGASNTLATTTGTALNVTNTTIGSSGLTFRSIASNGAASGIVLNNTGSSGGLTVSGNGSPGTGGTIQNSTGPGITLTSTKSPSFSWMNVQNGGDDGIRGATVNGLALSNVSVSGNGNAVGENGLDFTGLTGTATIGSSTFTGSAENNASIINATGSLNLTVTGSTFSNTSTLTGNDGIHLDSNDTSGITVSVTSSTFNHNRGDHFQLATNASASGTNSITFSNNTLTGDRGSTHGGTDLGGGVTINTDASSDTSFMISNNNLQGAVDSALKVDLGTNSTAGGTLSGTISGNTIGTAATADSGSAQTNGISATLQGSGTETVAITNNTIRQYNLNGINVLTRLGAPTMNATITGNTVANPGAFALNGIFVNAGASSTGNGGGPDAGSVCAGIGGAGALANSITLSGKNDPLDPTTTDFRVRQRFATTVRLPGYAGAAGDTTAVIVFIKTNNGVTPTGSATAAFPTTGGGFVGGAACPTP